MNSINRKQGIRNVNHSRCIMYQSRMRILKSRDGGSGRRAKLGEKILCENSFTTSSFVDRGTRKPCSAEKLLPPIQLMTKERSFRHLYLKYHPPKVKVRMDFLQKQEDPKLKRKREEIFARIQAAEKNSERLKREKERVAEHRRSIFNDGASLGNSTSEKSGNEDSQQELSISTAGLELGLPLTTTKEGASFAEDSTTEVVSGFVMDPSKKLHDSGATVISTNSGSEEEAYGDCFAFLADWKKEKKKRSSIIRR
jgi:hypothetical protein